MHQAAFAAGTGLAVVGFVWGLLATFTDRSLPLYATVGWIVATFALWLWSRLMPWD